MGLDGEDRGLGAIADFEFLQDDVDMNAHRARSDTQTGGLMRGSISGCISAYDDCFEKTYISRQLVEI